MGKFKFNNITTIAIAMLLLVFLGGCSDGDPRQTVYEGKGFFVIGKQLGDKPERGKYVYQTKDQSGEVTIWCNGDFDVGDTLFIGKRPNDSIDDYSELVLPF